MESTAPQYMQLLGLGVLWVSVHCAGMCGPIMAGLVTAGAVDPEASARSRAWTGARRVLAYQAGRAVTYAVMGAIAGSVGHAVESVVEGVAGIAGLIVGAVLILSGLTQIPWVQRRLPWKKRASSGLVGRLVGKVLRKVNRVWPQALPGRMMAIGAVMGLLPCMLMFWVLSLAASTASPWHGAAMMLLLVALTTPVLVAAGSGPLLASPALRSWGRRMLPGAVCLSGLWMGLIAMASRGWIDHLHFDFAMLGKDYHMMFW